MNSTAPTIITGTYKSKNSKLGDLFKSHTSNINYHPHIKMFNMYESEIDLLVLSVAFKRHRTENNSGPRVYIENLLSPELFKIFTPDDIEQANIIRDYYSKKLMMLTLKSDNPMTPFRKDLSEFVNSNGRQFVEKILPLAFRLPEFYEYDKKFDEVVRSAKEPHNLAENQYLLLDILNRVNKNMKRVEYWFVDHKGKLACYSMAHNNTLAPIWDNYINSNNGVVTLNATKYRRNRDGIEYWDLTRLA
jgi:hypothetical protein